MAQANSYLLLREAATEVCKVIRQSNNRIIGDKSWTDVIDGMLAAEYSASGTGYADDGPKFRVANRKLADYLHESMYEILGDRIILQDMYNAVHNNSDWSIDGVRANLRQICAELVKSMKQLVGDRVAAKKIQALIDDELAG